jgi:Fur family peroxide stress response transcriptional regulator
MRVKEEVIQKLRSKGLKITPQRMAIVDVLKDNHTHPSVEEIYRKLSPYYPTISYATIYKTLETLCMIEEIVEVNIEPHKKRYDPVTHPHYHFRCFSCGKIEDIPLEEVAFPQIPANVREKYGITHVTLYLYGLCPACRAKAIQHSKEVKK